MIKLLLSPQFRRDTLSVDNTGDVLKLNGVVLYFAQLPDGATLPREAIDCPWIAGDVQRIDGVLHVKLVFPHGAYAGEAARFPAPITVIQDGPVQLPDIGHDAPQSVFSGPVAEVEPLEEESHEQH